MNLADSRKGADRKVREEMLARELTPYGKDLKCQLVRLGMTQVELAGKVGTTKQYLGKIIFGERTGAMYLNQIDKELLASQKTKRQDTLTSYGKEVKCRLIQLDMTQIQLAEMVGTTKQYLGKILHGKRSGAMYIESINRILGLETGMPARTGKTYKNDKSLEMVIGSELSVSIPEFIMKTHIHDMHAIKNPS